MQPLPLGLVHRRVLLRHWLSTQASERVPKGPCLTSGPPTHPLSVVLCLRLSPWTAETTGWRADEAEERPPTTYQQTPGFNSNTAQHHLLVNIRQLSSYLLCLSWDIYEAPAAWAKWQEKRSVCAELKVCPAQRKQVSILNGGTGSDR